MIKRCHPVFVTGKDHHKIIALTLHLLQKNLNRFSSIISLISRFVEVVSLVNEQDASLGAFDHLFGFRGRVPHILTNKVISGDGDHMAFAQVTEAMKNLRHLLRNSCFSGSWLTGERHVQAGRFAEQIQGLTSLIHQQQSGDLTDSGFDRPQTDQLGV